MSDPKTTNNNENKNKTNASKPTNIELSEKNINVLHRLSKSVSNNFIQSKLSNFLPVSLVKKTLLEKLKLSERQVDEIIEEMKKTVKQGPIVYTSTEKLDYSDIVNFINLRDASIVEAEADTNLMNEIEEALRSVKITIFERLPTKFGILNREQLIDFINRFAAIRVGSNEDLYIGMKYFLLLYDILKEKKNPTNKSDYDAILLTLYLLKKKELGNIASLSEVLTFPFSIQPDMNIPIKIHRREDVEFILRKGDATLFNPYRIEARIEIKKYSDMVVITKYVRNPFDKDLNYATFYTTLWLPLHTPSSVASVLENMLNIEFEFINGDKLAKEFFSGLDKMNGTAVSPIDDIDELFAETIISLFIDLHTALSDEEYPTYAVFKNINHNKFKTLPGSVFVTSIRSFYKTPKHVGILIELDSEEAEKKVKPIEEIDPESDEINTLIKELIKHIKTIYIKPTTISKIFDDIKRRILGYYSIDRKRFNLTLSIEILKRLGVLPGNADLKVNRHYIPIRVEQFKEGIKKWLSQASATEHMKQKLKELEKAFDTFVEMAVYVALTTVGS